MRIKFDNSYRLFDSNYRHPGFLGGLGGKESACNVGGLGLIPRLGIFPGGGHGNPFQYSCLENSIDREDCQATVHGLIESDITE